MVNIVINFTIYSIINGINNILKEVLHMSKYSLEEQENIVGMAAELEAAIIFENAEIPKRLGKNPKT